MSQHLRICMPEIVYHVTNRGNNRQKIFLDEQDCEKFRSLLQKYAAKFRFKLFAYTLMPNHVHILLETSERGSISKIMHGINLSFAKYFNRKYDGVGHVWQGRFHSTIIDSENYFIECMRYMDLNPVRARLVDNPSRYPWSSYGHYARGRPNPILTHHETYDNLADTHKECCRVYREYVAERLRKEEEEDQLFFTGTAFLGTKEFVDRVIRRFNQEIWPKRRRLLAKLCELRESE